MIKVLNARARRVAAPSPEPEVTISGRAEPMHSFQYSLLHCLTGLSKPQGQVVLDMGLGDHAGDITSHGKPVFGAQY